MMEKYGELLLLIVASIVFHAVARTNENETRSTSWGHWDSRAPERRMQNMWQLSGTRCCSQPVVRNNASHVGARQRVNVQSLQSNHNAGTAKREKRLFSLFTVVKFANDICIDTYGENGSCISSAQCSQRRGVANGVCANGYGVCCTVTATCGESTSDNNTYFVNRNYPSSFDGTDSCQLTILKSHPDVCQFRLDFVQFNVRGPETTNHVCAYDQFIVSGASPVPPICGNNAGNHSVLLFYVKVYVDAGVGQTNPVTLTVVATGSSFPRTWKIRVSQIPCSTIYRGEEGCLQYYTGVAGQVKSFNYDPNIGLQLSNQDYSICIRMERNFCGIRYTPCQDQVDSQSINQAPQMRQRSFAFTLTGNTQAMQVASVTGAACQTDWLMIPCASNVGRIAPPVGGVQCVDRLCGGTFNSESQNLNYSSVVGTVKPFRLVFHTDGTEAPNDVGNRGFCLNYIQQPCTAKLRR